MDGKRHIKSLPLSSDMAIKTANTLQGDEH
jgi:hypothetical protein